MSKFPVVISQTVGTTEMALIEQGVEQLGSVEGKTVTVEIAEPAPHGPFPFTV